MARGASITGRTVLVLGRDSGSMPILLSLTDDGWVIANAHLQINGNPVTVANPVPITGVGPAGVMMVDIVDNVTAAFDHGSNSAIGVAATQFIAASIPATLGVEVKAANSNAASVYVGNVDVTAATVDATDGMELGPGESVLVRIDDVNKLYGISTLANQRVFWLVV